jgi:hypothetical protein
MVAVRNRLTQPLTERGAEIGVTAISTPEADSRGPGISWWP